jgi:hypothetical protein
MASPGRTPTTRRVFLAGGAAVAAGGIIYSMRRRIVDALASRTRLPSFAATPPLVPHDPARDRRTIAVAAGGTPEGNVDAALARLGGIGKFVGTDDLVILKVSAQWWNQGMTNVAAVKRAIEQVLDRPGFRGEVVVFENVHFRLKDGSGLARAFVHPSVRNVDVPGWDRLGDLGPHFARLGAPVSLVGLVDAGTSALSDDDWWDPEHLYGTYGGDGRGPIAPGEIRDGYWWDFDQVFRFRRSLVDHAQTFLSWPRFTSPHSGLVVDLKKGIFRRDGGRLVPEQRKLTWINMTTANEHGSTGFTGACKSTMGVVDMSAGRLGTDPRVRDYRSVHYFGSPDASWRMAGPLAWFAREVRAPDLILTIAEWVAATPVGGEPQGEDLRHAEASAFRKRTVVAGVDPVAIDTWCVRNLLMPIGGPGRPLYDLDDQNAKFVKFLRYYRQVYGSGTMDLSLVDVA